MKRTMKNSLVLAVVTGMMILGAGDVTGVRVSAQEAYRLVSAQVIAQGEQPPILKLMANGPVAFRVLSAAEAEAEGVGGLSASPNRVVARLYGVAPGDLARAGVEPPFTLSVRGVDHDTLVTIDAAGLPPAASLALRAGMRSNELQVSIVSRP